MFVSITSALALHSCMDFSISAGCNSLSRSLVSSLRLSCFSSYCAEFVFEFEFCICVPLQRLVLMFCFWVRQPTALNDSFGLFR